MKIRNLLALALMALSAGSLAEAKTRRAYGPNTLAAYVRRPDPAFGWTVAKRLSGDGWHGAVLALTSQRWLTPKDSDRPVWKHWLTVIVPDEVRYDTGFLYITGGNTTDPAPDKPAERFAALAVETHSVVAELDDVPNQPIRFPDSPNVARVEDGIIAHQDVQFAKDHDPEEILRFPMVKSGTAAMTAIQQYLAREEGGRAKATRFVVSGGSKRAWTTWLVGAIDPRVRAIIPVVINVLDVDATTRHHWEALGYFSPALKDYVDAGLIPGGMGKPGLSEVNRIEDPLNYRNWPSMKMPKYIINAVGDEYFPPDNTRFSYHLLPQFKRLRMLPNSKHSTAGTDIFDSMTAFYDAILNGAPIPDYRWSVRKDGALVVKPQGRPTAVKLWQATNPKARDFRVDTIGKAFTAVDLPRRPDGSYVGKVDKPAQGWTAYFVEITYPGVGQHTLKFTTEVYVTPDTLPYRWEDARPITAPDGR